MVLMVSLVEWIFVVVLWFFLCCCGLVWVCFLLFFYPIHPVYLQLSFTPHLKSLTKPNLLVLILVKVVRNSTYKVGWKEWETNCHTCIRLTLVYWLYPFQQLNSISNLPHHFYLSHLLGVDFFVVWLIGRSV